MRARLLAVVFACSQAQPCCWALRSPRPGRDLDVVLDRAGWYLDYFVDEFENVVAEENYIQDSSSLLPTLRRRAADAARSRRRPRPPTMLRARHRDLRSDFLLVKSPDTQALVPFRDVIQVDGIAVRDREARLAKLFLTDARDAMDRRRTHRATKARATTSATCAARSAIR